MTTEGTAVAVVAATVNAGEVVRRVVGVKHTVVEGGSDGDCVYDVFHMESLTPMCMVVKPVSICGHPRGFRTVVRNPCYQ